MHEMKVKQFCCYSSELVLEEREGRFTLPLKLAPVAAFYLAHELRPCRCDGISTYQLLRMIVNELGGRITRGVIDASERGVPTGFLVIEDEGRQFTFPCDPADVIAIAIKAEVPIYATSNALAWGGRPCSLLHLTPPDIQEWLKELRPEDFGSLPPDPSCESGGEGDHHEG